MAIILGSLALPDALQWTDRSALTAASLGTKRRLDGGLAVFPRALSGGRPITLRIPADVTITYADQLTLEAMAAVPGASYALSIPELGFTATVMFDHRGADALDLSLLFDYPDPADDSPVIGTLKLLTL
jgi:hypothetical protein